MESEEAQPVVISVATPKGGAGKTTTCVLLALQLAREGYRVLAVDTDPQASLTRWSENAKSSGFSLENITIKQISMIEASEQEQALVSIINNAVDHDIVLIAKASGTFCRQDTDYGKID